MRWFVLLSYVSLPGCKSGVLNRERSGSEAFAQAVFDGGDEGVGLNRFAQDAREVALVEVPGFSGHDDDGDVLGVRLRRQFALNVETMQPRQTQVEHDGGGDGLLDVLQRVEPVIDSEHGVAGAAKRRSIKRPQLRIIFDDQNHSLAGVRHHATF